MILFSDEAREGLKNGIQKIYKAVSVSLGPKGRYALLERKNKQPVYVDDGVTIAKEIILDDPVENSGASIVKESSLKTNDITGDGTSTSTILTYAIIQEAQKYLTAGYNPIGIKNGLKKGIDHAVEILKNLSQKVYTREQKLKIVSISCLDEELSELVVDAVDSVGAQGYVTIENGNSTETVLEVSEGLNLNEGWISPYFANQTNKCVLENSLVLVTDKYISSIDEIVKILEIANRKNLPIFIVSYGLGKEVLATLLVNKIKAGIKCAAMKPVGYGEKRKERFQDIALLCGAVFISEDLGMKLDNISEEMMGLVQKIEMDKSKTVISCHEKNKEKLLHEIKRLEKEAFEADTDYLREHLETRIADLSGKVASIKVGGNTETEILAKKLKIEDSKNALLAAIKDGIIIGGGVTYLHASESLFPEDYENEDEKAGIEILSKAMKFPVKQLAFNSGYDGNYVAEKLLTMPVNWGFDVMDGKYKCFDDFIVDPVMVEIKALEHAVSIACQFICTECVIISKR